MSHEFRAPLAAIKGAASTALEDPRDRGRSELRQYLRIVEEQAGRILGLTGDLLDAGLIGAGMLSVDPAPEALAGRRYGSPRPSTGCCTHSSSTPAQ